MTGTTTNGGRREDVSEIALRQSAYEHHCPKFIISTLIKPHKHKALYSISLGRKANPLQ